MMSVSSSGMNLGKKTGMEYAELEFVERVTRGLFILQYVLLQ